MKWNGIDNTPLFSCAAADFKTVVPYAVLEDLDGEIRLEDHLAFLNKKIVETDFGNGVCCEYVNNYGQIALSSRITVGENFAYLEQTLKNESEHSVYFKAGGYRILAEITEGDPKDYTLYSLHKNEAESLLGETEDRRDPYFSKETLLLYRELGKHGFAIAPVGSAEAFVHCSYTSEGGSLSLEIESDMCSVRVDPGEWRAAQDVVILDTEAAHAIRSIVQNYARHLGTRVCGEPPYGWCSWYDRFFNVEEGDVFGVIDYYSTHPEAPRPQYVQIDEGWEKHWGDWHENDKFPSGLEAFVRRAQSIGVTAGLWVVPTWVKEELPLFNEHPDWFARYPDGSLAVPHNWLDGQCWGLDITHPDARAFALGCLRELYQKGIRYFKIDSNIFYTNGHTSHDPRMTTLQAVRSLYADYRKTLPEAHINSCTAYFCRGVVGYADSCRIAADVDRDWNTRPEKITAYYQMSSCAIKAYTNGVLFYNDPDVLYLMGGERLNPMQRRLWLSFVTLSGGTVGHSEIAPTLEAYPDEQALIWPPSAERGTPVYPCTPCEGQRFGFVVQREYGNFGVFLLWNATDASFCAALSPVLSPIGTRFHVFSFWEQKYLGVYAADSLMNLDRETGGVYRFTPVSSADAPLLIASTLHLSMGVNEIVSVTDDGCVFSVSLVPVGARHGSLYFYSKLPLTCVSATGCQVEIEELPDCIWKIEFHNRTHNETIKLRYRK